ncbi:Nudix family hydrolase [Endothiovibrio diazotrophicus]
MIHVAAAAVFNGKGEVLIARRHEHQHQGGLWEFPGGKVEEGEAVDEALARELHEELGIDIEAPRPLIRVRHDYPDQSVLLDVWRVERFSGEPHGKEGQPVVWVDPERLGDYDFPAANRPIVTACRLPERYLITREPADDAKAFLAKLRQGLGDGVRLVQLRAKGLAEAAYERLAEQALAVCRERGARLLLNGDPALVARIGADGVHLTASRLLALEGRPLDGRFLVTASCHDLDEVRRAEAIGADFAVISPVLPTQSHPGAPTLGWPGLRAITEEAKIPLYALGGMKESHLDWTWTHGAQGYAAITGLWPSD